MTENGAPYSAPNVAKRLKALRRALGVTQEQFAASTACPCPWLDLSTKAIPEIHEGVQTQLGLGRRLDQLRITRAPYRGEYPIVPSSHSQPPL